MTSEDVCDILTFTKLPAATPAVVKLGSTTLTNYDEGVVWATGSNTLTITLNDGVSNPVVYTITVTKIVPPSLSALSVGGKTLTPTFSSGTKSYTMSTESASDILTFTTVPADMAAVVKLGSTVITGYGEGVTWAAGSNTLTITLEDGVSEPVVYTVAVTAPV